MHGGSAALEIPSRNQIKASQLEFRRRPEVSGLGENQFNLLTYSLSLRRQL
jgi:hypothetical protein